MYQYENPIIPGFNPDPSICLAGDTFYLVTSTFEFFPGVPIYSSKNLVDWDCIGHCLTRESQLNLTNCWVSGGIYAPTIRYHDGTFFMVTTNVSNKGNFIVHTEDPSGIWSEPVWVKQGGIDPSLLFDNGKVYFVSNGDCKGNGGIFVCEINPFTGEMLTDSILISEGCGGRCAEAPHIYHVGNMYYLMLAEGGTEYGHMVTISRSENIYGPYAPCPHNPILSHKDQGYVDIFCTGHADIIEDQNGSWWMVCLGIRTISTPTRGLMLHNLGRESFLTPVIWENGWPVVGEGNRKGTLDLTMKAPLPAPPVKGPGLSSKTAAKSSDFIENFDEPSWNIQFTHIRNPIMENYILCPEKGLLTLEGSDIGLSSEKGSPAFIGIRQTAFCQEACTELTLHSDTCHKSDTGFSGAGLSVFYNNEHHYDIMIIPSGNTHQLILRRQIYDLCAVTDTVEISSPSIRLKAIADKEYYFFYYALPGGDYQYLGKGTTAAMCTEITRSMTFTGTFWGMYAENCKVDFHLFTRTNIT